MLASELPLSLANGGTAATTAAAALASLTGGHQQVFYLDSYTGTDDQKMTSALSALLRRAAG